MNGGAGNVAGPSGGNRRAHSVTPRLSAAGAKPSAETAKSLWRHSTPFGVPVVPPVYTRYRSS